MTLDEIYDALLEFEHDTEEEVFISIGALLFIEDLAREKREALAKERWFEIADMLE